MPKALALIGQVAAYAALAAFIGYFAAAPAYVPSDPALAQIKFSFTHGAARLQECRRYTPEELSRIAPNMRRALECQRERVPVVVELELDGQPLLQVAVPPIGIWKDGPAVLYRRFTVPPGPHRIMLRLRDDLPGRGDARRWTGEWNYVRAANIVLKPRQNFVIDFRADKGGFVLDDGGGA